MSASAKAFMEKLFLDATAPGDTAVGTTQPRGNGVQGFELQVTLRTGLAGNGAAQWLRDHADWTRDHCRAASLSTQHGVATVDLRVPLNTPEDIAYIDGRVTALKEKAALAGLQRARFLVPEVTARVSRDDAMALLEAAMGQQPGLVPRAVGTLSFSR